MLFIQPLEVISLFYESRTEARYVVWIELVASAVYVCLVAAFIFMDFDVRWFLVALLVQEIVVQVGALAIYARHGYRPTSWRFDTTRARRLVGEGSPLVLAVGAALYLRIDQVMLGQMTTAAETGTYAAAARLSETWFVVPGLIVASAFPFLLRLRQTDPGAYGRRLQQLYDLLAWLGVAVAVALTITAPWLVALLYGHRVRGLGHHSADPRLGRRVHCHAGGVQQMAYR